MNGNIVVATEVARRYGHQGIVSISLNPGTHYCHHISTFKNISIYLIDRKYQNRYTKKLGLIQKGRDSTFTQTYFHRSALITSDFRHRILC